MIFLFQEEIKNKLDKNALENLSKLQVHLCDTILL